MPSTRISPSGTTINARPINIGTWPSVAVTTAGGTDTTPVAGTIYYASVFIPGDILVTGVKFLLGSASTNGTAIVAIYNESGTKLANSATAGTTTGTAATAQSIALTTPITLPGPGYYLIGVSLSSTSDRLRTVPAQCDAGSGILAGSVTGTYGTLASSITVSSTAFTAATGPIASLY